MGREILFRGKVEIYAPYSPILIDEWAEGYHYRRGGNNIIYDSDRDIEYIVDPATVGQYTGLYDKNGVKIFEGDVVASDAWCCKCHVVYMDGGFTLEEGETAENLGANFCDSYGYELDDVKVIGNIHDTKEEAE